VPAGDRSRDHPAARDPDAGGASELITFARGSNTAFRAYALGNIRQASLRDLAGRWMERVLPSFNSGMTRMDAQLAAMGERVVVNSYALAREVLTGAVHP